MEFPKDKAALVTGLLRVLANEHRLMILCHLVAEGELGAGALVTRSGLSQSALSQHLGRLREEGLVACRRESQSIFYRIGDSRAERVLALLHDIFCPELGSSADQAGVREIA